ncbi:hypothetical protein ACJMK2_031906 [Sinanodonta woodiana]|uniref:BACK domain-containing protein n=1 Tax=Sinanodonta woodiana TaxID=1069815 RepID=A0ABD3X064_SINWO
MESRNEDVTKLTRGMTEVGVDQRGNIENDDEAKITNVWKCLCSDNQVVHLDLSQLVKDSRYFDALSRSSMRETKGKEVHLKLISSDTLQFLLRMHTVQDIYCLVPELKLHPQNNICFVIIENILTAVDYLNIPCLIPKIEKLLTLIISKTFHNIVHIWRLWQICETYNLDDVKKRLGQCIADNIKNPRCQDCFLEKLPVNLLEIILKMPNLEVDSEVETMSLIKNWINFDKPDRLKYLNQLYRCIHVPSLFDKDLDLVVGMFNTFGIKDERELNRMFTLYTSSPHKYFLEYPDEVPVRNGRDLIIMIGGVECKYARDEEEGQYTLTAASNRLYYTDVETITEIFRTGHGNNSDHHTFGSSDSFHKPVHDLKRRKCRESPKYNNSMRDLTGPRTRSCEKKERKTSRPTKPKVVKCTKMKWFRNLACPIGLVEFGICIFNNFIYIAGGQTKERGDDDFCTKSTFCLDPHIGEWTEVKQMKNDRCQFYLGALGNGLYAVGGSASSSTLKSVECYLTESDTWVNGPDLPFPLHGHAGSVVNDKLYVSGGNDGREIVNVMLCLESGDEGKRWVLKAPLLELRSHHVMEALDNQIYVLGGYRQDHNSARLVDVKKCETFNTVTNQWTLLFDLDTPISCCLPVKVDNYITCIGGCSFDTDEENIEKCTVICMKDLSTRSVPLQFAYRKRYRSFQCIRAVIRKSIFR